jgi:hypothetical protein
LSLGVFAILPAFATSIDAKDGQVSKEKRITAAECERLVKQLISPYKPPFTKTYVHELPKGLEEDVLYERQKKIEAAYNKLSKNIEVALPILAKHLDDDRFSYVYEVGPSAVYQTMSVGGACARIIYAHVEVYQEHVTTWDGEKRHSLWFIFDHCGGIDKWWKRRKGKTLAELQLEGIEWALRQKKPKHFESDKEWAKAKKSLEKMAKEIRASKKPIKLKHEVEFFSK